MKKIIRIDNPPTRHWVGDGFPVHGMFGYNGEVAHRDSAGGGGVIGVGDVQWMTAGSGTVHDEFHSEAYSQAGGAFEMVQLWVNLPAKDKMTAPGYQAIVDADIPVMSSEAGQIRVIAGMHADKRGPAQTHTPMNVWDLRIKQGKSLDLAQPIGWTTLILVQSGSIKINDTQSVGAPQLVVMSREGSALTLHAEQDAKVLLLAGAPIDEPVFGYGPFVMNTRSEIVQAIEDFNSGKFGNIK